MSAPALEEICRLAGIAPTFTDVWGEQRPISPATCLAVLRALGVDATDEHAAASSLEARQAQYARQPLPPVIVVQEGDRPAITVTVPQTALASPWRWQLLEEDGREHGGEFIPGDCPPADGTGTADPVPRGAGGAARDAADPGACTIRLELPHLPAPGYHRLSVSGGGADAATCLVVAPQRCYQPQAIAGEQRVFGLVMQLFSLRSARNWGIGDFTDLTRVLEFAAEAGADMVTLNPLHALYVDEPAHASPYSPSNRLFLNPLYLDVEEVADLAECEAARAHVADPQFQARLRALRAAEFVEYREVAALKYGMLVRLYRHFRRRHLDRASLRGQEFRRFQARQGRQLRHYALFEALQTRLRRRHRDIHGWQDWPAEYRSPASPAVARFERRHRVRVEFFEYLQWQAALQLDGAGRRAMDEGLGIGICQDLAVGIHPGGAEAWGNQNVHAFAAHTGSPPDEFSLKGQDWGLVPWIPSALRDTAYAPFVHTLRANMRAAGALRIDHVMGLSRLYWIPEGHSGAEGAYVHYPVEELLGILALESQRNQCLVIGEDLGTVAPALREALRARGVLGCRLFYFERDAHGAFRAPAEYPGDVVASVTTHDLPTLSGFWAGRDIAWRRRLDLFPAEGDYERAVIDRAQDRTRLLLALQAQGLLPEEISPDAPPDPALAPALAGAVHAWLAQTPARILAVQVEDLLGESEQPNLPGTTDEHPNWRRRLPLDLELWSEEPQVTALLDAIRARRSPPPRPAPGRRAAGRRGAPKVVPRATYRLQLHAGFTLDDAAATVPYLAALGVSHVYVSPIIRARPGSMHGYDIVDHGAVNPELGGRDALERFTDRLADAGLGLILDIVPNHMGVMGRDNGWWLDVLTHGPASRYADYFDIEWYPLQRALHGKVLLPVLGDHYGDVLDRRELQLTFDPASGAFAVEYYEHLMPLDPREYPEVFRHRGRPLAEYFEESDGTAAEFASLMTAFSKLPPRESREPESRAERARDTHIHQQRLAELYAASPGIAGYVIDALRDFNGSEDYPADPTRLHDLLERQPWRLAAWHVASDQINYRRFFDINDLAALRMERDKVFDDTHALVLALIGEGRVQGLRIDHPDGLFDPAGYFRRLDHAVRQLPGLQAEATAARTAGLAGAAVHSAESAGRGSAAAPGPAARGGSPVRAGDPRRRPLYVVAEKILAADEHLPTDWCIDGLTGYEFARQCGALFVDPRAGDAMHRIFAEFTGNGASFEETAFHAKRFIMEESLASELGVLANQLGRIAEDDTHTRDFTVLRLLRALTLVVACLPVYRTYITEEGPSPEDEHYVRAAVNDARRHWGAADVSVFDFLRDVMLTSIAAGRRERYRERVVRFAMKLQQYTSPVAAKGVEDTAFYRYHRLVSLNEVGGAPECFGLAPQAFHATSRQRRARWPHSMLASSTHDAKRSEDVRSRIDALSEMPEAWGEAVRRWRSLNRRHKRPVDDVPAPSPEDEYLLYQTLIGTWPDVAEDRIRAYMLKAARESKLRTSWLNVDAAYEEALDAFVSALLDENSGRTFLAELDALASRIRRIGMFNSLSQAALRFTAPGVPDIYQGCELWDLSLVDPDNRRPVDFAGRAALLDALSARDRLGAGAEALLSELLGSLEDGRFKLYLSWICLRHRQRHPALYRDGDYVALDSTGPMAGHIVAFARRLGRRAIVVAVPRLIGDFVASAQDTPVASPRWNDTALLLPRDLADLKLADLYTGNPVTVQRTPAGPRLTATALFERAPLALLCPARDLPEG